MPSLLLFPSILSPRVFFHLSTCSSSLLHSSLSLILMRSAKSGGFTLQVSWPGSEGKTFLSCSMTSWSCSTVSSSCSISSPVTQNTSVNAEGIIMGLLHRGSACARPYCKQDPSPHKAYPPSRCRWCLCSRPPRGGPLQTQERTELMVLNRLPPSRLWAVSFQNTKWLLCLFFIVMLTADLWFWKLTSWISECSFLLPFNHNTKIWKKTTTLFLLSVCFTYSQVNHPSSIHLSIHLSIHPSFIHPSSKCFSL